MINYKIHKKNILKYYNIINIFYYPSNIRICIMTSNYLISIIIPVFNSEYYIKNTINSIKSQTIGFDNIELIFVDDCSTDNTKNILEEYSKKYNNIKCIYLKKNSGFAGKPRNIGIKNATADYIMFLDSDDIFYEYSCELLYNTIYNNDLDVVSGTYIVNNENNKNIQKILNLESENDTLYIEKIKDNKNILSIPPAIMSKIYKKSVILENNITFPIGVPGEDLIFLSKYYLNATGILFINKPIFEYNIRNSDNNKSVSYTINKTYLSKLLQSYKELFDLLLIHDKDYIDICLTRLNYWIQQFISSNLLIKDKIVLLHEGEFLFNQFKKNRIPINSEYTAIFEKIFKKDYIGASVISNPINNNLIITNEKIDKNENKLIQDMNYLTESIDNIKYKLNLLKIIKNTLSDNELKKGLFLIKKYELFDSKYYIETNNYDSNFNPLLHYLSIGHMQNKCPNKQFDNNYYKNSNIKIKNSKINPLLYFVLYGMDENNILINENIYPYHKSINKNLFKKKIEEFDEIGITTIKRKKQLIVCLTSFSERLKEIPFCVYSLLTQELKPDKLILWLSYIEFPNKEKDLPQYILDLKKNGLTIKWCDDLKSYKKIIPSLIEYPNDIIVTADDDIYYPKNWLKQLYDNHKKYPNCIISQRSRKILLNSNETLRSYNDWQLYDKENEPSFLTFPTTGAGALFPPNSLYKDVVKEEIFKKLSPNGDDIWIWGMAVLNQTKIKCIGNNMNNLTYINLARECNIINEKTLFSKNKIEGKGNDKQIKNLIDHYPKIIKILKNN